jgi:hypothetical protein
MKTEWLCLLVLLAVLLGAYFVTSTSRVHEEKDRRPEKFELTAPDEDMSDMEIINTPDDMDELRVDTNQGTFGFGRMGNSFFA